MKRLSYAAMLVMFAHGLAFARVSATWTGAADNYWTNAANWLVEGVVPERCPGVVSNEVGGAFAPALPSGDIAVFDGTCANGRTAIDLDGLYSVQSVQVSGANCPKYVFGVSPAQMLPLETNGVLSVDATVPAASCPVVNAALAISNFDCNWWGENKHGMGTMLTVVNNSTGTIEFNSRFANDCRRPGSPTYYMELEVVFGGTGNFRFSHPQVHDNLWLRTFRYQHTGTIEIDADFICNKRVQVKASSRIVIAEGCTYGTYVGNNVGYEVSNGAELTVEGAGTFRFVENKGAKLDNCGYSVLGSGTLSIHSKVESYASSTAIPEPRIILSDSNYNENKGLKLYCPDANIPGGVLFRGQSQLTVASTNSLGNCGAFEVTNSTYAAFRWEGVKEEEALAVPVGFLGGENSVFTVWNMGEVPFAVRSEVTAPDNCKTLALDGRLSPIVCAPDLNGSIALRLSGDVVLPENSNLSNCFRLELKDCRLVVEGDSARSLPPVSVLSGDCSVSFAGSAALALPSVVVVEGSVDFKIAGSGATVSIQGKTSSDIPPPGLLIDGHESAFSDDGGLLAAPSPVDASIASRGAVVPDGASRVVGITHAGTGADNVLAADNTAVKAIVQQSDDPSVIAIGEGQSLAAEEIAIDHGGSGLSIGSIPGKGAVLAPSSLKLRNDSYASSLVVNAEIGTSGLVKTGAGSAVLAGGMAPTVGSAKFEEGVAVLENGVWNTDSNSKMIVTNGATLVVGGGARLISEIGAVPVNINKPTIEVNDALLKIQEGATVTNMITLNPAGAYPGYGRVAAVHQTGGTVFEQGGDSSNNFYLFGNNNSRSMGYWEVAGGTLCLTGRISMCGDNSLAAIRQTGGSVSLSSESGLLRIGSGQYGHAEYVMTGGKASFKQMNLRDWGNFPGATASLTVDGTDASFTVYAKLQVAFNNAPCGVYTWGALNLVSGKFCANQAVRGGNASFDRSNVKGFVNFNGGTFKTRVNVGADAADGLFGGDPDGTGISWIDYVTVYSGGATIETDDASRRVYVRTPFRKPEGRGIFSIVPIRKRTGLIAPPHVVIEGDGKGASAYALFDREKGEVTGIRIASPGWGYTVATARLLYGSPFFGKGDVCTVELADVKSGGLAKTGPGTLVLAAASTYTGETVLKGGTLELAVPGAVPAASIVAYEGGALVSTSEAFPKTLRVRIPGAEDESVRRCTIATFLDSCPAVLPQIEVVNVQEDEKRNWIPEYRGLSLCVRRVHGTVVTVR